jgi:hypothetical protein
MALLEKQLVADFNERTKQRLAPAAYMKKLRAPFQDLLSKDSGVKEAMDGMRRLAATGEQKRRPPQIQKVSERIFTGSVGATVTPPYDYQWMWNVVHGTPQLDSVTADANSGNISVSIWTSMEDNSPASLIGRSAVGIYFYPPAANGSLQVWSTPALAYQWGTFCNFDSAHADGWIGLFVDSFDLAGTPTGPVVDQMIFLWSDDSWWGGTGWQAGSNSGYPLYAPPIQVDQDHQYVIDPLQCYFQFSPAVSACKANSTTFTSTSAAKEGHQ